MIFNPFKLGKSTGFETWTVDCLGNNLIGWYDGTDSGNMVLSGSDVTELTDLSGNGHNLTAGVANPPEFVSSYISFDGTQALEEAMSLSTDYGGYFLVADISGITANPSTVLGFSSISDDYNIANEVVPLIISGSRVRLWQNGSNYINLGTGLLGGKHLFSSIINSTSAYGRSNGLTQNTAVTGFNRFNFDELTLGRSFQNSQIATFNFYELIVFKGDITTDQYESIEWYLANKHGLTLDGSHTYVASNPASCDPLVISPPSVDLIGIWNILFSAENKYQSTFSTMTGSDGNDYFLDANDLSSGKKLYGHSTNTKPSSNTGFVLVNNGMKMNTDEIASLKITTDEFAHGNGDFSFFFLYTWDGNTNDTNYKKYAGGKKGFKLEGASSGMNILDTFNTQADESGTSNNGNTFSFDPDGSYTLNNSDPYFFGIVRDTVNQKYKIYTGIVTSASTISDLKVHDSIEDSGLYLTNPFGNNGEIEFLVDEDSILHALGYTNNVVDPVSMQNTYTELINIFT